MIKRLFLAPGRLLLHILAGGRKKNYRSTRSRPSVGIGAVALSAICWLVLAGGVLYAVDKAGLLKQALDAGVEAAGINEPESQPEQADPPGPPPEPDTPTATGSLNPGSGNEPSAGQSQPPADPPRIQSGQNQKPPEVAEMWLVILHSIPKNAREEAERWQRQYKSKGLTVDILDTDAFPQLLGGHWIVALGPFDNKASATLAANEALKFNSKLMVRRGL